MQERGGPRKSLSENVRIQVLNETYDMGVWNIIWDVTYVIICVYIHTQWYVPYPVNECKWRFTAGNTLYKWGWLSIVVLNYQTDPNVISSDNGSLVVWGVKPMSNLRSENHEPICKVFYKVSMTAAQPVLYFSFWIYEIVWNCAIDGSKPWS